MPELTPEEKARAQIDKMLAASGWVVQSKASINLSAARGVAICELSFATGEPDYTLFVDGKAIGTVEEGSRKGSASRHKRTESERFKSFTYDELLKRDKVNLDIFWLKDEALEESANLPASEITDDLEAALEQFATIAEDLKS